MPHACPALRSANRNKGERSGLKMPRSSIALTGPAATRRPHPQEIDTCASYEKDPAGLRRPPGQNGTRTRQGELAMNIQYRPEGLPEAHGLYDPRNEHDACGIGLIANIHNVKSHRMVADGLSILKNLEHRGAVGADPKAGDGAGLHAADPARLLRRGGQAPGLRTARRRPLWRGPAVHAARARLPPGRGAHMVGNDARGRPQGSGLARRAG